MFVIRRKFNKKTKNGLNEGAEFEENNVAVDSLPEL